MSLGPERPLEEQEATKVERIQKSAQKILRAYFDRPLDYLFYSAATATVVSLFLGRSLRWDFYVALGILAGLKVYQWVQSKKVAPLKENG